MKKESFFDKRSNRVVGGICLAIIAAVAAFVLAPYLCHFGIQAMTVASTGPHNNLLFALGLYSFMASIPIFGSAVWHGFLQSIT